MNSPQFLSVPIDLVLPDPDQPRREYSDESLAELAESIRAVGIVQPIVVRSTPDDNVYRIIAGERRHRAAQRAELHEVPIVVRDDLSADDVLALQIVENLHREGLTLRDTVAGVQRLVALKGGVAQAAIALGKPKPWVSRHNSVVDLWQPVQALITEGVCTCIDTAHNLSKLHDISPAKADQLVKEFRAPPAWRGGVPTRELLRHALDEARKEAAEQQSIEQEKRELRERQQEGREPPTVGQQLAAAGLPPTATPKPIEAGRARLNDLREAAHKRLAPIVGEIETRLAAALRLQNKSESPRMWIDADGAERYMLVDPIESVEEKTDEQLAVYDPTRETWRIEADLHYDDLLRLLTGLEGKSPNAARSPLAPAFQSVQEFAVSFLEPAAGDRVKSNFLWTAYCDWLRDNSREGITAENEFNLAMEAFGYIKKRCEQYRYWADVRPRSQA